MAAPAETAYSHDSDVGANTKGDGKAHTQSRSVPSSLASTRVSKSARYKTIGILSMKARRATVTFKERATMTSEETTNLTYSTTRNQLFKRKVEHQSTSTVNIGWGKRRRQLCSHSSRLNQNVYDLVFAPQNCCGQHTAWWLRSTMCPLC